MCNCLVQVPNTVTGLELDIAKWNTVIETDSWKGDWTPGTRYFNHDIVRYGGVTKRCITGHVAQADDNLGIESDDAKWETLIDGIEYIGNWQPKRRFKCNCVTGTSANRVHNYTQMTMVKYLDTQLLELLTQP